MDCRIRSVKGNWHAAFKHGGVEYTHSLRTRSESEAEVRLGVIRDTLYRLENGTLTLPPGGDAKAFILSGGQLVAKPTHVVSLTISQLADHYLGAVERIEANTKKTKTIHLNHIKRLLGANTPLDSIRLAAAQTYAQARRKQKHHGRQISAYTIRKELRTFHQVWAWSAAHGHTPLGPTWNVDSVELPKDRGREPFRDFEQINRILKRGHLAKEDENRLWECLYLHGHEVSSCWPTSRNTPKPRSCTRW